MTYIYFDESGDLGFDFSKTGTSSHFLIACIITNNKGPLSKLVKKVFLTLPPAVRRKSSGILHACEEKPSTIKKLLIGMTTKDVKIATICIDKRKIFLTRKPNELYAEVVISLLNRLYADGLFDKNEHIELIASRCNTSRSINERFTENVTSNVTGTDITVGIAKPADDKCLQVADFVAWSFGQKYAKDDNTYVDLIADKVVREYNMY